MSDFQILNVPIPEEHVVTLEEFYESMQSQKYRKHYERLVTRAQERTFEDYTEKHHVIPKCLGGTNNKENLVRLTAEEHYVAHQLLVKCFISNAKLAYAANMMTVGSTTNIRNNKAYGWIKRLVSEDRKTRIVSKETRNKMSESSKGRGLNVPKTEAHRLKLSIAKTGTKQSAETKLKISITSTGSKRSKETCTNISVSLTGKKREPFSEEWRKNIGDAHRGLTKSAEVRAKISEGNKGREVSEEHRKAVGDANKNRIWTEESIAKRIKSLKRTVTLRKMTDVEKVEFLKLELDRCSNG